VSLTPAFNLCHGFFFIGGVVDTSEKIYHLCRRQHWKNYRQWQRRPWTIIAGENSTGDKFIASINDYGEQWSPVTTTPTITFFSGVVDTGHKEPKSLKFIAGVNDTAEKLFTGVNDTADKFFGGVTDTGD
jgi:hypothetical protein